MTFDEQRFGGIARLYGQEAVERLAASHVAVVGIGGVGSWAAEALARSGVGRISLFDLDDVCVSNTNRQVHALDGQVGRPKVTVMAERIQAINPACAVKAVADFVTRETMADYITEDLDLVLDCIDSVASKAALIAWCKRRKIAIVTTRRRWRPDRSHPDPGGGPQSHLQRPPGVAGTLPAAPRLRLFA
ncbi:tRNA A37 threonylcarbamoyladenosine dehydratase [Pseudomonas psychrotolerans]|nr:tRNA A37 threonylcarbamoyladenosine dehydratase [Pseudomonas psychrotolerans]